LSAAVAATTDNKSGSALQLNLGLQVPGAKHANFHPHHHPPYFIPFLE